MNIGAEPQAKLDRLLTRTSRTFAASIPLLPPGLHRQVAIAYLLFRVADTFEDGERWHPDRKRAAFGEFTDLLASCSPEAAERLAREWRTPPPCRHEGYTELIGETPFLIVQFASFPSAVRHVIAARLGGMMTGVADCLLRADAAGNLELSGMDELRHYCYLVAGLVGEMLTDLYLLHDAGLEPVRDELHRDARYFGEGLQLVNILKDREVDRAFGRRYLNDSIEITAVFELAAASLDRAARYVTVCARAGADSGVLRFMTLPLFLAWSSLAALRERGAGAKVSRAQVLTLLQTVMELYRDNGDPRPAMDLKKVWGQTLSSNEAP